MKVSTRLALGAGLLCALLCGVLVYHVSLVKRLVAVNSDLVEVKFEAARLSLELIRRLDELDEVTRKYVISQDPRYRAQARALRHDVATHFDALARLAQPLASAAAAGSPEHRWVAAVFASPPAVLADLDFAADPPLATARPPGLPGALRIQLADLERLRAQAEAIYRATRLDVEERVRQSVRAGRDAERVSLGVVTVSLLLALLVGYLTIRSIHGPLQRLIAGTHAVAAGEFRYQLDASRRDELGRVAAAFNLMVRRLGELDQVKQNFLAHVSHELKTPLATLQETHRLLLDGLPGPLTAQQERLLRFNLESSQRLSTMLAKLLDLARLEAGGLHFEMAPCDLGERVMTALQEQVGHFALAGTRLAVELERQLVIAGDGDRLVQVVRNLLENARKYALGGGTLTVRLERRREPPADLPPTAGRRLAPAGRRGYALLKVADEGPGVPDAHKEQIFDKFHQVGRPRPQSGVGLGLAISREIVEAHAGAIWVVDHVPRGSCFQILLPLAGSER